MPTFLFLVFVFLLFIGTMLSVPFRISRLDKESWRLYKEAQPDPISIFGFLLLKYMALIPAGLGGMYCLLYELENDSEGMSAYLWFLFSLLMSVLWLYILSKRLGSVEVSFLESNFWSTLFWICVLVTFVFMCKSCNSPSSRPFSFS